VKKNTSKKCQAERQHLASCFYKLPKKFETNKRGNGGHDKLGGVGMQKKKKRGKRVRVGCIKKIIQEMKFLEKISKKGKVGKGAKKCREGIA